MPKLTNEQREERCRELLHFSSSYETEAEDLEREAEHWWKRSRQEYEASRKYGTVFFCSTCLLNSHMRKWSKEPYTGVFVAATNMSKHTNHPEGWTTVLDPDSREDIDFCERHSKPHISYGKKVGDYRCHTT